MRGEKEVGTVYDANDNILYDRRRSGDTIGFSYDALNRTLEKTPPSGGRNVFYSYDLLNRLLAANYDSIGGNGSRFAYDVLGRVTGQTTNGNLLSANFDAAGDRTSITYSDGYVVNYLYDYLQRPTQVCAPTACPANPLATYSYDDLGRLTHIARPSLAGTGISYTGPDLVHQLTQQFAGTSADITWTYGYDAGNQLISRAASNDNYTSHPGALSHSYTTNGLNQYSKIDGTTYSYDTRGNLTTGGYTYDVDNNLLTGPSTTLGYDPLDRLWAQTVGGTLTRPLFDGGEYIATYDNSGNLLSRVVPSQLGNDSPLVWFSGSATTTPSWLHTDNQGSIVAQSNASGTASPATPYGYDPYGVPDATNGFGGPPLRYTGQMSLPSLSLYYYKARDYDPNLGRFLQTDPSGTTSDINLYAYTGNAPTNATDATGLADQNLDKYLQDGGGPADYDGNNGFSEPGDAVWGGSGSAGGSSHICTGGIANYDIGGFSVVGGPAWCGWVNNEFGGNSSDAGGLNYESGGNGGYCAPQICVSIPLPKIPMPSPTNQNTHKPCFNPRKVPTNLPPGFSVYQDGNGNSDFYMQNTVSGALELTPDYSSSLSHTNFNAHHFRTDAQQILGGSMSGASNGPFAIFGSFLAMAGLMDSPGSEPIDNGCSVP